MAEKSKSKFSRRNFLARRFVGLGQIRKGLPSGLTFLHLVVGMGMAVAITVILIEFQFQSIPNYQVGDIADRTIEASEDFTVRDEEATEEKRLEAAAAQPAVFRFDFRVNTRIRREVTTAFSAGREAVERKREELALNAGAALPLQARSEILGELESLLPRHTPRHVLEVCLRHSFSEELEAQLLHILTEAMKFPPGVVFSRDNLFRFQDRGIVLVSGLTGKEDDLTDWTKIRDLNQAQEIVRQNEFELTSVGPDERKVLIAYLEQLVGPNIDFDESLTLHREQRAMEEIDAVVTQIKKGKTIVRVGDEITDSRLDQLNALRQLQRGGSALGQASGIFLIVAFFLTTLWIYFEIRYQDREKAKNHYLLLLLVTTIGLLAVKLFAGLAQTIAMTLRTPALQDPSHFYLYAPVGFGAILVILLVGIDLALLFSMVFAVFAALMTGDLAVFVYTLTGSLAGIYALGQYRERSAVVRAGLIIGGVSVLVAFALQLYSGEHSFSWSVFLVRSAGGLASGLLAAMLASVLLPLLESMFGVTTDIRLLELSNLNSPILRRLAVEAPGTYHHSIIVGTLAEAGAEAILSNTLLVRVAAYYHDIGKLKHPEYYVENQTYCGNKHEALSPTMSSLILASHVKDGLAIAQEIKLAPKVAAMIPQHHGTRLMTFFYQKAKDAGNEKNGEVKEEDFRYPGPKPQSKEAAILMLADQVEAAARTLQDPTQGQIRSLIKRLIQSTIQDGQFEECDISMKELSQVAQAFERVLTGMYHHRIEYPGFDFNRQVDEKHPAHQRIQ
ncbi:MAG TPA: HDIG domain-containing protein [Acidobacteriota bacterium]|nr:HDIG domain-containing protein [Acidobacteriota bacterium]